MSLPAKALVDDKDALDDYIEARVNGPLLLAADVEALVLDPCFRGTDIERAAGALTFPVEWHPGFAPRTGQLSAHPGYRGENIVALGRSLARGDQLDARIVGERSGRYTVPVDTNPTESHAGRKT